MEARRERPIPPAPNAGERDQTLVEELVWSVALIGGVLAVVLLIAQGGQQDEVGVRSIALAHPAAQIGAFEARHEPVAENHVGALIDNGGAYRKRFSIPAFART